MKFGRDRKTKSSECPVCGKILNAAFGINHNKRPRPGDLNVCFGCGSFLKFVHNSQTALLTSNEIGELDIETLTELKQARALIQQIQTQRKPTKRNDPS